MSLPKKWKRYRAIISEVKNWASYFLFKAGIGGKEQFPFKLRNGMQIKVSRKMLGPFRECFFDNQYFGNALLSSISPEPFILDIGANAGFAALSFFYRFPGATIHSFEPMPFCTSQIEQYQKQFPQFKWHLHTVGVWSYDGELELFTGSADDFSTTSGINPTNTNQQKISIPVMSLHSFLASHADQVIDLLKMDCEGAEYEIMFKLPDANFARIRHIVMETHRTENYFTQDMVGFLRNKQFEVDVKEGDENGYIWARKLKV